MPTDPAAMYEAILERARGDQNVVSVLVVGGRATGELLTASSDVDAFVITRTADPSWTTARGSPVDVRTMTLDEFRSYALEGSPDGWDRPTFLRTRVDLDREGGGAGVARLVAQKASLDVDEARRIVQAALDDYINSLYRSLRNIEAGRLLEGRLDAGESIGPLLTTAFALEGRVRPFNKWLVVELGKRPLRIDGLLEDGERIAVEASPAAQRRAFLKIDLAARAAGHGAVVDSWEPDVDWLRGVAR
jgi:hypothetical protein